MNQIQETSIDSFSGEYRFLSNFYPVEITWKGTVYPSVENAYQSEKTGSYLSETDPMKECSPGKAKRLGRKLPTRKDWELER